MPGMIDTCNEALSEIAAETINSIDEGSLSSIECQRFYQTAITDLLAMHDWGQSIKRVTLAMKVNDRVGEWAYAYARPVDAGNLRRILPQYVSGSQVSYPRWGWWAYRSWDSLPPIPFIEDAGTIYTNIELAVLEYTVNSLGEADMRPLFRRALVYELAARLAMPIRKDRTLKGDMIQLASAARALAMADDQNRYPHTQPDYISDVELVRSGGYPVC